jgi:7-cyano-7-deazaguanine synthase
MESDGTNILLLLSGGVDSTALLDFYLKNKRTVETVFIDYGQAAAEAELKSSEKISKHYGVKYSIINLKNEKSFIEGEVPFRNAFLIFSSLMHTEFSQGIISMGIHSGTEYSDCSEEFQNAINELLKCYTGGELIFFAPFLKWTKKDIFDYCERNNIPIEMTYSCERGEIPPCGKCMSCRERSMF